MEKTINGIGINCNEEKMLKIKDELDIQFSAILDKHSDSFIECGKALEVLTDEFRMFCMMKFCKDFTENKDELIDKIIKDDSTPEEKKVILKMLDVIEDEIIDLCIPDKTIH